MPWLTRKEYQDLMKRNDDRDFAQMRSEIERVLTELRAFKTMAQRRFKDLEGLYDDDEPDDGPDPGPAGGVLGPDGLRRVPVPWAPQAHRGAGTTAGET